MSIVIPNVGETVLLNKMIKLSDENYNVKLFKNDLAVSFTVVVGDFTEATFPGYTAGGIAITKTGFGDAALADSAPGGTCTQKQAIITYGSELSWTYSGASTQTIYGYYVVGATSSSLLWFEKFAVARTLGDSDVIRITPKLELRTQIACS